MLLNGSSQTQEEAASAKPMVTRDTIASVDAPPRLGPSVTQDKAAPVSTTWRLELDDEG